MKQEMTPFDFDVWERILRLNIGINQADNAKMFELMSSILPLDIRRYAAGREHNGWVIPHNWVVNHAFIKQGGRVLFDGKAHPLAVAGYSSSFSGKLTKEELDQHVFFNKEFPNAYVFHCVYNYRPWKEHWGFCVPYNIFKEWGPGEYTVELQSKFTDNDMLVAECNHHGELQDTIVFNSHTCHPCQANDDMSGCMVILELFKWLTTQNTRYSYKGLLAPEHLGTVFYIADLPEVDLAKIKLGCFLEMTGTDTSLALQKSFTGVSILDRLAEYCLRQSDPDLKVGGFRTIVGNDETVWEAPGIEIPMISISRFPYRQYHTSEDNLDLMSKDRLAQSLDAVKRMIHLLENDRIIERKFKGLVALSNPKYNLYKERPDPVVNKGLTEMDLRFGYVQDSLPRYFNGEHTIFEIAEKFDISFEALRSYLDEFEEKGLVKLRPLVSLGQYKTDHWERRH